MIEEHETQRVKDYEHLYYTDEKFRELVDRTGMGVHMLPTGVLRNFLMFIERDDKQVEAIRNMGEEFQKKIRSILGVNTKQEDAVYSKGEIEDSLLTAFDNDNTCIRCDCNIRGKVFTNVYVTKSEIDTYRVSFGIWWYNGDFRSVQDYEKLIDLLYHLGMFSWERYSEKQELTGIG